MKARSLSVVPHTTRDFTLANWVRSTRRSDIQELLGLMSRPDIISFALGLPAREFFPSAALSEAAGKVLESDVAALQYGPPYQPLKTQIVSLMKLRGVSCAEEEVFLTTGAQQGMNLLARLSLDNGGQVITEQLIYSGFRQVLEPFQPEVLAVPTCGETGMDVEAVEYMLRKGARPAFIYAIADGHNPVAVSMEMEKRLHLVELARRYAVPVVEDDAYGFLSYESASLPPLKALEPKWVWYVGTWSKILAPGLRAGWVVVPREVVPALSVIKEASDIDTSSLAQRLIWAYLDSNPISDRIRMLRREYAARRDAMLTALHGRLSGYARWKPPAGGFYVWIELPEETDAGRLLEVVSRSQQVVYVPGHAFSATGGRHGHNCMRLSFSNCPAAVIEEGIKRLAQVIEETGEY